MNKEIKRIAVFTSGGDAPGMNAAIRAVVRNATYKDLHVYGVMRGYEGLINGDMKRLETADVGNIIHRGGTILKTARSQRFMTVEGRRLAFEALEANEIDGCVAIGGNGTFTGAAAFMAEYPEIPFVGVPGTIDNDLFGTDFTIGFDTAVNTAVDAVDKIRDTADSHNRLFFVEVMGRHSGFIALNTAIAGGAGGILIPEKEYTIDDVVKSLKKGVQRNKLFSIIIVAEGSKLGNASEIAEKVKAAYAHYDTRVAIIGHLQRGGSPTFQDRVLASRLGFAAVEALTSGEKGVMIGLTNDQISYTPFADAIAQMKPLSQELLNLGYVLSL